MNQKYVSLFLSFLIVSLSFVPSYVYAAVETRKVTGSIEIDLVALASGTASSGAAAPVTCNDGETVNVPAGVIIYKEESGALVSTGAKTIQSTATISSKKDFLIATTTYTWCYSESWSQPLRGRIAGWVRIAELQQAATTTTTTQGSQEGQGGICSPDQELTPAEINLVLYEGRETSSSSCQRHGRLHNAVDLAPKDLSRGTLVIRAPEAGRIATMPCPEAGECVTLTTPAGSVWTFGHLVNVNNPISGFARNGDNVVQCQNIGVIYSGSSTGFSPRPSEDSTGPHVHVELNKGDPTKALQNIIASGSNCEGQPPPPVVAGYPLAGVQTGMPQSFNVNSVTILTDDDKAKNGNQVCVGRSIKLEISVAGYTPGPNLNLPIAIQQNNEQQITFNCRPGLNSAVCVYEGGVQSKLNPGEPLTTNLISVAPIIGNTFGLQQQVSYQSYSDTSSCDLYHARFQVVSKYTGETISGARLSVGNQNCAEKSPGIFYCTSSGPSATLNIDVPPRLSSTASTRTLTTAPATYELTTAPATPPAAATSQPVVPDTTIDPDEPCKILEGTCAEVSAGGVFRQGLCGGAATRQCRLKGTENIDSENDCFLYYFEWCETYCRTTDSICLPESSPTGDVTAKNLAGNAIVAPQIAGGLKRYQQPIQLVLRSANPNPAPVQIQIEPDMSDYLKCSDCLTDKYVWCPSGAAGSQGVCAPTIAQCAAVPVTNIDLCPEVRIRNALSKLPADAKARSVCDACTKQGGIYCLPDKQGFSDLNSLCLRGPGVCPPGTKALANPDACSLTDDIVENIIWNELIAFGARYLASRSTPKFVQPPNDWEPTDGVEVPAAILKKRGTHICEDVSAAKINGDLDKTNALSSEGAAPLFEAGDPITISGNVEKFSSTCNGLQLECRDHQILGCKVSDKLFYLQLSHQKCEGEYNSTIDSVGDNKKIWDWGFIVTVAAGVILPFFMTEVDPGTTKATNQQVLEQQRLELQKQQLNAQQLQQLQQVTGQLQYSKYTGGTSIAGLASIFGGRVVSKETMMRAAIGILAGFFSKPNTSKERCFTVCGKEYATADPSRDTCENFVPAKTKTGAQVKREAAVQGPKITLSYNQTSYGDEFGCAKNTACGAYPNARVDVSLIAPSGGITPLDSTRTDSLGNYDVSFNAPAADGTFNAVIKVKGVPPVQSSSQISTSSTKFVSTTQLTGGAR
ncbi:MAG: hypothetical protein HY513_04870 [Candidatus Aenigmarchaeota archaeon]|nr:hypothetical protein [Candidatus Aenigmarchaeota archaeon]